MGAQIHIVVVGQPVAKGRARVTVRGGFARAYTPAKTQRYEDLVRLRAGEVMEGREPLEGAARVQLRVFVQTPQAIAKHKTKGPAAENGSLRPTTRPDVDNFCKAGLDALNGIVWRDDSQVVELLVEKFYSTRPRLELTAVEL